LKNYHISYQTYKIPDLTMKTLKKEILGYYMDYNEAYDYVVSENLELDYELVCR